jgi:DNA gyrase inhibitor GyrI
MEQFDVRIVDLEPMRVASVRAEGESPEEEAFRRMRAWAEPRGLLEHGDAHPLYGFNNPYPRPDRRGYGYELWMRLGPTEHAAAGVETKQVPGGRYAATTCRLADIEATWRRLAAWAEQHGYRRAGQELERPLDPLASTEALELELLLPIERAEPREDAADGASRARG